MANYFYGYYVDVKRVIDANIDIDAHDVAILEYLKTFFIDQKKARYRDCDGKRYFWVTKKNIMDNLPLCRFGSEKMVYRKLKNLCDLGLLEACSENQVLGKSYFLITSKTVEMLWSNHTECAEADDQEDEIVLPISKYVVNNPQPRTPVSNPPRTPVSKEQYNNKEEHSSFNEEEEEYMTRIIGLFNLITGTKTSLTHKKKTYLKKRLAEGRTIDEFEAVFRHKHNEWKDHDYFCRFIRIQTLCADSHFQDYLEEAQNEQRRKQPQRQTHTTQTVADLFGGAKQPGESRNAG